MSCKCALSEAKRETRLLRTKHVLDGNYITHQLFVINIYAPNKGAEQELFIRNLGANLISKTDITKIIIAGDWNGSLFPKDKSSGLPWKETNYRNSIVDLMDELDLVHIYRKLHPNTKAFTYESKSFKLRSRIDYFLVSNTIAVNAKGPRSDHLSHLITKQFSCILKSKVNLRETRDRGNSIINYQKTKTT